MIRGILIDTIDNYITATKMEWQDENIFNFLNCHNNSCLACQVERIPIGNFDLAIIYDSNYGKDARCKPSLLINGKPKIYNTIFMCKCVDDGLGSLNETEIETIIRNYTRTNFGRKVLWLNR